jgi:hypothetical protein
MRGVHLICIFLVTGAAAQEKVYICGYVNDIATLQPLSHVNIYASTSVIGATDRNGSFCLILNRHDSLAFTRIGYQPQVIFFSLTNWDHRIFLRPMNKTLNGVTGTDTYKIHGSDEIQKRLSDPSNPLENITVDPRHRDNMIQTFGPGISARRVTKETQERKRLESTMREKQRTEVFVDFINSAVMEEYFMELFSLDRETLVKFKEDFVVANPDARYLTTRQDIVDLMAAYFATRK